ncbi:MAG: YkgJ family cysteine cluster protein [Planctomycetota bacterium]
MPECQDCGACCFAATPGHVRLTGEDHARLLPAEAERTVFRGTRCFFQVTADGRCVNLVVDQGRYSCAIYERRPQVCRDYERGGEACAYDRERVHGPGGLGARPG